MRRLLLIATLALSLAAVGWGCTPNDSDGGAPAGSNAPASEGRPGY